uniref:Pyrin domain-containing protein n=1 Tax=Salmo trutta TaxID=8032 RepID=A0A674BXP9_SALTR
MLDVPALLLTTLMELNPDELNTFQSYLPSGQLLGIPPIPWIELVYTGTQVTVDQKVKRYGPEGAVEITLRTLRWMDLDDLAEQLERFHSREPFYWSLNISSLSFILGTVTQTGRHAEYTANSKLPQDLKNLWRCVTKLHILEWPFIVRKKILDVPTLLLTTLQELTEDQLKTFQSKLNGGRMLVFPPIPKSQLRNTDIQFTVDQMVERYGPEGAVEITLMILRWMNRPDVAEKLERDYRHIIGNTIKKMCQTYIYHSSNTVG